MERHCVQIIVTSFLVLILQLGSASPSGLFMDDADIENFLRLYNTDVMLWSCKNGIDFKYINPETPQQLSTSIALKCDVLGVPSSISIEHNFYPLNKGNKRFQLLVGPHFEGSKMFYEWKEYIFKINDPTTADSGLYRIFVRGPSGKTQQQLVYVNLKKYEPLLKKVRDENRKISRNETKSRGSFTSKVRTDTTPKLKDGKSKPKPKTQSSKYHRQNDQGSWPNY